MRDLEIRGAGNILGPEQSGHIATVGYEMYCQLLEEAVRTLKKEAKPTQPDAHVDIGISAFIPKTFIPGDRQRMDVYRRLTRCNSLEMLHALEEDVKDAFGELPRQAIILFALTELRLLAGIFGIESLIRKDPDVVLKVYLRLPPTMLEPETLLLVLTKLMGAARDRDINGIAPPPLAPPPVVKPPVPTSKIARSQTGWNAAIKR